MIVLDSSVVLKWMWSHEAHSQAALRRRDQHLSGANRIAVPELLFYEVANVLATKTPLSSEEAVEEFTVIADAELESYTLGAEEFSEAIRISKRFKISLYDSSYLALAAALGCQFITADERLTSKVNALQYVELLR